MEAIANAGDITITGDRKQLPLESRQRGTDADLDLTDINVMNSPYFIYSLMIIFILNH
jgi:polysaccharide export outer membrane protein